MTTARPTSANRLFNTFAQTAALLLLATGLSGAATTASAQTPSASPEAGQWEENFDEQMARQLKQKPALRASLIEVVIDQALRKEDLRLTGTAEALLHVVEEGSDEQHRVLAIQALSVIGPEHLGEERYEQTMNQLYVLSEEDPSAEVQTAAAEVLTQYQDS
ncbi:MAG: hypothetical protein BRD30_01200 [Bacteroidetes bacterium QH_2_63_10]|nr:MAG: hypothetical protein BRD30_01200 [Bacteroidetes bacterium QH_2_63_10]